MITRKSNCEEIGDRDTHAHAGRENQSKEQGIEKDIQCSIHSQMFAIKCLE